MKKYLLAAAFVLAGAAYANAACSTSKLASYWNISADGWCKIRITSTGTVSGTCDGASMAGKLSLNSSCLLTGKVGGFSVTGRVDSNVNLFVAKYGSYETITGYRIP